MDRTAPDGPFPPSDLDVLGRTGIEGYRRSICSAPLSIQVLIWFVVGAAVPGRPLAPRALGTVLVALVIALLALLMSLRSVLATLLSVLPLIPLPGLVLPPLTGGSIVSSFSLGLAPSLARLLATRLVLVAVHSGDDVFYSVSDTALVTVVGSSSLPSVLLLLTLLLLTLLLITLLGSALVAVLWAGFAERRLPLRLPVTLLEAVVLPAVRLVSALLIASSLILTAPMAVVSLLAATLSAVLLATLSLVVLLAAPLLATVLLAASLSTVLLPILLLTLLSILPVLATTAPALLLLRATLSSSTVAAGSSSVTAGSGITSCLPLITPL